MPHETLQSRRPTLPQESASPDGTWVMSKSLTQSLSDFAQLLIPTSVIRPTIWKLRFLTAVLVLLGVASPGRAQHQFPGEIDYTIPQNPYSIPDYSGSLNSEPTRSVGGYGVMGRAGHEAGDTVGRNGSLSYFDLAPFSFNGDTMFFGDGRLFVTNRGKMGGSAGLGIRHFFPAQNSVLGTTFYYDHDESRGVTFEQFTVAGELLTEFFDFRANVYLPFGKKQQVTNVRFEPGTQMFVDALNSTGSVQGSNINFQTRTFSSAALEGADLTLTTPIPGPLAERINLEATAGGYHYQARGLGLQKISGFKLRLDGDFFDNLTHLSLEVTSDNAFDTNVVLGADINYWHHLEKEPRLGKSQYSRMASWVRRSRTVSTLDGSSLDAPQLAINPDDGLPYLVYHVRNNPTPPPANFPAPLGNGSENMPFQFMQEAIDASPFADIVFVHANSVFDGVLDGNANATAVLRNDVLVLGEGVPLKIPVVGIAGEIDLPTVTGAPAVRPLIQNVTGPVITMADNSRFAGFTIENYADGPAVLANGVNGAELNELIINGSTGVQGTGIEINASTGTFIIENISISDTAGNAFVVTGGNAAIAFNGANSILNSSGLSVLIEDAAGSVNMRGTSIIDDGGEGILVTTSPGNTSTANVTFDQIMLLNTNSARTGAFQVERHSGGVTVLNDMVITTPGAGGITIQELQPSGSVVFQGAVTINNRNERGVFIQDIQEGPNPLVPGTNRAGNITFQNNLAIIGLGTTAAATPLPAIQMDSSSGTVTLNTVNIDQSLVTGIEISNLADTGTTTGRFLVGGPTTINNTLDDAINIDSVAKANFQSIFSDLTISARGAAGVDVFNSASITRFLGTVSIDNQLVTTTPAILVQSNTGDVAFNSTAVVNALGQFGVLVIDNRDAAANDVSNVSFSSLSVEFTGLGVVAGQAAAHFENNDDVSVGNGIIDATTARGITVLDNDLHDIAFESISANDVDFGIFVSNSIGRFMVTGLGGIAGSGGTISGMTIDGAHFDNTQVVQLGFIDFDANRVGVHGDTLLVEGNGLTPEIILRGLNISDSLAEGVQMFNVSDFMLLNSTLNNNGLATNENQLDILATVRITDIDGDGDADDLVTYNVDLINNDISDGGTVLSSDMILIRTGAGIGAGADLNFNLFNNGVPGLMAAINNLNSNRAGAAALNVSWTGDSVINMDSNTFLLSNANNQTAVELNIDGLAAVAFTNNDVASSGVSDFGLDFTFEEATNLVISDNSVLDANGAAVAGSGFQMTGINATGISLTFQAGNNNVFIENNLLNMSGVDHTGIEFQRIFAPSNVTINNNAIFQVTDFDTLREEGLIFRDVRGVINLNGTIDNAIPLGTFLPFYVDFFIDPASANGQIIVNGAPVP